MSWKLGKSFFPYREKERDRHCPPLRHNPDSSSASDEIFSPCKEFFSTRYVIGTYSGSDKNLKRFPSFHGNYRYVRIVLLKIWPNGSKMFKTLSIFHLCLQLHAEHFSYDALKNLVNCAALNLDPTLCCSAFTRPTVANCKKTQGNCVKRNQRFWIYSLEYCFTQVLGVRLLMLIHHIQLWVALTIFLVALWIHFHKVRFWSENLDLFKLITNYNLFFSCSIRNTYADEATIHA